MHHSEKDHFFTLLDNKLQGTLSADELKELEALVASNQDYKQFYSMVFSSSQVDITNVDLAFDRQIEKIEALQKPQIRSIWPKYLRIAASILLLGLLGYFALYFTNSNSEQVYMTMNGEREFFKLEDGTEVWLNGGSKLRISSEFGEQDRRVELEGEGYFHVAKDAKKPFFVNAKNTQIRVLGTTFNVRAYAEEDKTETILIEGKVELKAGEKHQPYTMSPGEKVAVVSSSDAQAALSADDGRVTQLGDVALVVSSKDLGNLTNSKEIQWRSNKLVFDNESMSIVFSKLEKWYNVKIETTVGDINKSRFSGYFNDVPIDEVLKTLKETGNIKSFKRVGNSYTVE
ncbi:DUF4974 domain-containing protein [Sphingobacterium sp. DK4209]|uniref:DUF4974 domain-containing protein n=1 Tax=Sphingobacterium zhuxiongii TaxID=2662364 RepID=A0A5Q0Q4R1_9SPHI|nr:MULTISPECIES: FecR domain-containing protein [unclassified Sphingobacterium]MVZ67308.1 DUF4974 domain-containing protein [Sphingobacterium sp. DK4209]QGA25045.1 DUF4974 domain-containing protein [Sphingobacterium sp. dk4302]